MSDIKNSGEFVFNQQNKKSKLNVQKNTTPSKPDNIENEASGDSSGSENSLYTYSMGITEIEAVNNTYQESSVFVTKPIKLNENVIEVGLNALEEHPAFDEVSGRASSRLTSVEYYISLKDNPSLHEWIPILPKETEAVKSERLFFNGINAETLFPFDIHTVIVYKNGIKEEESSYEILNTQEIQVENVSSSDVYTVDYRPNLRRKNPYLVSMNDYKYQTERIVEEFPKGTDINKSITLEHVPFIDKQKIINEENYNPNISDYRPIDVSIVEGQIRTPNGGRTNYVPPKKEREDSPYMSNKTLYLDNSWSDLERYNLETGYLGIDYYQYKNKITLAEHINIPMIEENEKETPGTGTIRVSYDALITDFRLKVILRRNTKREITATPRLKEYSLKFKSTR